MKKLLTAFAMLFCIATFASTGETPGKTYLRNRNEQKTPRWCGVDITDSTVYVVNVDVIGAYSSFSVSAFSGFTIGMMQYDTNTGIDVEVSLPTLKSTPCYVIILADGAWVDNYQILSFGTVYTTHISSNPSTVSVEFY